MKTKLNIRNTALVALCALALSPAALFARIASKTAEERGIIKSVDNTAHQVVVTDRKTNADGTFQWNDQTKFTELGKTVMATDLKAGEHVRISYAPSSGAAMLQRVEISPAKAHKHAFASPSSHRKL